MMSTTRGTIGILACGAAALAVVAAAPAAAQERSQRFDIAAQSAAGALNEWARQAGTQIIFPYEVVDGRRTPAVRGDLTPREALNRLIAPLGLRIASQANGATVLVRAAGSGQASPEGTSSLDGAAGTAYLAGGPAGDEEEQIIVTGTNLRGARPTSPLITITRRDIDRTGATSVEQLMRTVPQNSQSGVNKENFEAGSLVPDLSPEDHGAGVNLRGLGQRATLVLVNGRRLAPSGTGKFVDISLIPISAVERVEILTDGASAIYGSDAVGGVVNFILRDSFEGLEASLQAGTSTQGGGDQLLASLAGGTAWESGRAMLAYEYRHEQEVRAGDRSMTIGLPDDTFLLPRERKHSIIGTAEQALAPGLNLGGSATYSHRKSYRTTFQSVSPLPIDVNSEAESVSLGADLSYELPDGWLMRLDATYGLSDSMQDQTQPDGVPVLNSIDVRHEIIEAGARVDGRLFALPAGPVRLAVGALVRREDFRQAFRSTAIPESVKEAQRTVKSAFGELLVPLFSPANRMPGLERLEISAAGRYDHYSRTGSTFDPKVGLLWSPLDALDLRGSYSTSFRAPLLSESSGAYGVLLYQSHFLYVDPSEASPGEIAVILQGSDPDVRPETSRTWTFGGDLSPGFAPGLTLTANYYAIRFRDRIALPVLSPIVIGNPAYESLITRHPDLALATSVIAGAQSRLDFSGPNFSDGGATPADVDLILDTRYTNTAVTTTSGFDVGVDYRFSLGANEFALDANLNHIIDFQDRLTVTSSQIAGVDRPYRPLDWRLRAGLNWSRQGWAGSLFVNHADDYRDDRAAMLRRVDGHTTIDATLSYRFDQGASSWLEGTRISLFVENLLDEDPPLLVLEPGRTRGLGYDPVNASARGRFVALQLRRTWQ